jgi:hypothetical protein
MDHGSRVDRDCRGAAYVQNLALIGLLGLPIALAIASLGLPLLRFFRYAQLSLVAPLP